MYLPITLVTACVAGLILIWLSVRVISSRVKNEVLVGESESEELPFKIRTQGNFSEYVPLFLVLLGLVEGADGHATALMAVTFLCIAVLSLYGLYLGLS